MGDHSKLPRSPTWPRFEIIFNEISKTPQTGNAPPSTPGAPRKPSQQVQRAASGLKPRKLTYGFEDLRSREEEDDEIMISEWVEEMSGHAITSTPLTSRSSFSMDIVTDDDDDNKENRPESGKRHKSKGNSRYISDDKERGGSRVRRGFFFGCIIRRIRI